MPNTQIRETETERVVEDDARDDAVVEREIVSPRGKGRYMREDIVLDEGVPMLYRVIQVITYLTALLEGLLIIRFVLRAFEANAAAGFTRFIYGVTDPFVAPFVYVFQPSAVSGAVLEWTTLLAIAVYALIAYALTELFSMGRPVSRYEARQELRHRDSTATL